MNLGASKVINLGAVVFVLLIVFIMAYFYINTEKLRKGPEILLSTPQNGLVVKSSDIEIYGKINNVSRIYLNGRQISIKDENTIKERLILSPGENIFRIEAYDSIGNKSVKTLKIIYKK